MRVLQVDPSAFTPPYDRSLSEALARAGLDVTLATSRFDFGEVPPAHGYAVDEHAFYRWLPGAPGSRRRLAAKLAQHVPDMLRLRRRAADLVHFQWLAVQHLDGHPLPRHKPGARPAHKAGRAARAGRRAARAARPRPARRPAADLRARRRDRRALAPRRAAP